MSDEQPVDDGPHSPLILAVADLELVRHELPAETAARLQVVLDEVRYDRVVLNREGHGPPWELSVFDMRQIESAVERLPDTEDERRARREAAPAVILP